ncbi:MAG: hypothetical protein KA336_05435 [Fusobacteriaceae bacterium]|nr:hypothetical protein [Fusobacteriaceae bacterium]
MKIENEFIPFEQALNLKELGFDEPCFGFYEKEILKPTSYVNDFYHGTNHGVDFENIFKTIPAPTFSQAFRWFKEKYGLMSCITPCSDGEYIFTLYDLNKCDLEVFVEDIEIMESEDSYEFFEEAELECLKKLIEIVKLSHKTATI